MKLTKEQIGDMKNFIDNENEWLYRGREYVETVIFGATFWDKETYDILMNYIHQKANEEY